MEGLVHVTALGNDYYHYDPLRHRMMGERSNRIFRLGDQVTVKVVQVNLDDRKIDFELNEKPASGGEKPAGEGRKPRKGRRRSGKRRKAK